MEQEYYFKCNTFEPIHVFECGQCFRWEKQPDGSYIGVIKEGVLCVYKKDDTIFVKGNCNRPIKDVCNKYFNLQTNYEEIKNELSSVDEYLKNSILYGNGIRILQQDLWECMISFIISANNNIPRIKKIIEKISIAYGKEIIFNKKKYYLFPTPMELSKASIEDLRNLGLGFRDKRVYDATKLVLNGKIDLNKIEKMEDTNTAREILLQVPGVGEKVADCIILFSLNRFEIFPVDVWVRRVMNDLYIKEKDEEKVSKEKIRSLAQKKYKNLAGIAQQYLFYWKRETG